MASAVQIGALMAHAHVSTFPEAPPRSTRFPQAPAHVQRAGVEDASGLATEIAWVLMALVALVREADVPDKELRVRIEQYVACAAGEPCPEMAFDPLARRIEWVAVSLASMPHGGDLLPRWVRAVRSTSKRTVSAREVDVHAMAAWVLRGSGPRRSLAS